MAITASRLMVEVAADTRELASGLNVADRLVQGFGSGMEQMGKLALAGVGLATGAITGLGAASFNTAVSVESAFAGIIKTTDGLTDEFGNLNRVGEDLKRQFRELALETPISAEALMGIGELGGQLGILRENLPEFARTIAALDVATNLNADEAALQLSQFMNIMGTAQPDISRLGSTIVDLGNNFATTERDIVNFGSRIAGAGAIAGLTEGDILGIATAFSSVGIESEAGGTAVQKTLLAMNTAVATGNEHLAVFARTAGMSASEFAEAWRSDPAEAFVRFVEGLGREGDNAIGVLKELGLEDQRLIRGFLSLAGAGDVLRRAITTGNEAWVDNNALTKEAEARYRTAASQIQMAKNQARDWALILGDRLLPPFGKLLNHLRETYSPRITRGITRFADTFGAMATTWERTNSITSTLAVGISGVMQAFGADTSQVAAAVGRFREFADMAREFVEKHKDALIGAIKGIGIAFGAAGIATALAAILNPMSLIIVAAGLLGAAWETNFLGMRDHVQGLIDYMSPAVGRIVEAFQGGFQEGGLSGGFRAALAELQDIARVELDKLGTIIYDSLPANIQETIDRLVFPIINARDILNRGGTLGQAVEGALYTLINAEWAAELGERVDGIAGHLERFGRAYSGAKLAFEEGVPFGEIVAAALGEWLSESTASAIGNIAGNLADMAGSVKDFIAQNPDAVLSFVEALGIRAAAVMAGGALLGLKGTLAALVSPVGLLAVGLGTLWLAWDQDWGGVATRLREAAGGSAPDLDTLSAATLKATGELHNIEAAAPPASDMIQELGRTAQLVGTRLMPLLAEAWHKDIRPAWEEMWATSPLTRAAVSALGEAIIGPVVRSWERFKGIIHEATNALRSFNDAQAEAARWSGGGAAGGGSGGGSGGFGGSSSNVAHRQTGGLVDPRRWYMVGEGGPELFMPAMRGRILSTTESRAALAMAPTHSSGSSDAAQLAALRELLRATQEEVQLLRAILGAAQRDRQTSVEIDGREVVKATSRYRAMQLGHDRLS